ncbi:MAG: lamin tail domain-containing protein, partial [Planctomycetota bacterium]
RVDSGAWRDSGYTESGLSVGSHTVEYNAITDWDTPINETVQINDGLTTTTTGTYIQQTGSLQVTISPPGAVTAGAKWRVDSGAWRDSDYTESGLSVGSHTVEYNTVVGWDTPINETVQINDGLTTTTTGTYVQQTGSLQVTISPPGAVTAGAKWRVDSGFWRDSSYTEVGLPIGLHTVDFNEIVGWTKPANQIVQINDDLTTTTTGNYIQQTHALLTINEFMASNTSSEPLEEGELLDGNDESSDWIEIYNPTDEIVDLNGWYMTDDDADLTMWQFPDGNQLDPGEFMIIFASQKTYAENPLNYPYLDPAGYYHTNFELYKGGDYLALVAPDGNTVIHEYTPEYPDQLTNISYGLAQYATTLVSTGATVTYHVPISSDTALGTDWTEVDFNDSSWDTGKTGIGFGAAGIPYENLLAYYEFEGDVNDSSGNGRDGTLIGSISFETDPDRGEVLSLPGGSNQYVLIGGVGISGTMPRTIACWAKADHTSIPDWTLIFGFTTVGGGNGSHFNIGSLGGPGGVGAHVWGWEETIFTDEQALDWHHYAMSYDGTTITYYGDGIEMDTDPAKSNVQNLVHADNVHIGSRATQDSSFPGKVDDACIYSVVLSEEEIGMVMSGSAVGTDVQTQMQNTNGSLWTRIEFNLEEGQRDLFDTLMLRMKYEDGFVAYLNGQYVTEQNAPASLQWNSTATSDRPSEDSLVFEEINLMAFVDLLQTGTNVLAIHGLNDDPANDEFLILPELVAASNVSVPQYFTTPTPGAFNITGAADIVSDVWFSHKRGFYDTGFQLMLSNGTNGAEIRYTLDGSRPTLTHGITYTGLLDVNVTTTIRAVAVKPGWLDSPVETHTYIFLDNVLTQSPNGEPPGPNWPSGSINNQVIDYGMDPDIVNDGTWGTQLKDALMAIPTISIVTDLKNLFDPGTGIYVNAGGHGYTWERPTSLELIYPPNPQGPGFPDLAWISDANGAIMWGLPLDMRGGFQINAGLRIRGGYSRSTNNPKHAFRFFFRREYGDGKLNYPLFGDEGVESFDKVDLRTSQNYSWSFGGDTANAMCRDVWARDSQGLTGQAYTRSRYYHLYINGQYWGLFQTQERGEAAFGESYFGGDRDDWDCVKAIGHGSYEIEATDGTLDVWQELWDITNLGFASHDNYYHAQGLKTSGTRDPCYPVLLDVDNLIDYMMMVFYDGDRDAPISNFLGNTRVNNWYGIRDRTGEEGFRYFVHDAEHTMSRGLTDRTGPYPCGDQFRYFNPQWLHQELMAYPDYRLRFADRAYKRLFNNGLLTPTRAIERFQARADQINMAIIAESARWGDSKVATPRTKNDWLNAISNEINNFFPGRSGVIIDQYKITRLITGALAPIYPSVEAPSVSPAGGWNLTGFNVTMNAPAGIIYYTTDGNDPRLPVVQSAPGSVITLMAENASKSYFVPTSSPPGSTGSILSEYWTGITGTAVSNLTSSPDYPGNPTSIDFLTSFEIPIDWADNYGTRVRGYLHPPASNNYTFWISSDDASELWLSTDDDPINKVLIASIAGWCQSRDWNNTTGTDNPNQQSASIPLTGGQKYYIEALQKEEGGGDNLAVAWSLDNNPPINGDPPIGGAYLSPAGDNWATNYYDDSNWPSGIDGVGYERNPGDPVNFVGLFNINVEGDMYGNSGTCYIRIPFTVSHTDLSDMTLKVRYDDGFVAYLNGAEVARRNFTGTPKWDSIATGENPDSAAVNFENIDISAYISTLQQGDNLLAIHGLNYGTSDSDFLISVEIVATEIGQGDVSPSATSYSSTISLDRSTKVKARVLDGTWSAMNEAIFAVGPVADQLRITEIMYHPKDTVDPNDQNTEFIELKNIGPSTLYLNLVKFTEGIHFTFPDVELVSGGHIVVVKDINAFDDLYDIQTNNINVAGWYTGSLANNAERIRLQDAVGQTILDFEYEDDWRPITDGDGFSLTIIDPTNSDPNSWSEKDSWRASVYRYGSPDWDDSGILPNPGAVVINEVMAHSNAGPDWIELHNTTGALIDIGGWFLSDNNRDEPNLMKYRIPDGTTIADNGHIIF